MEAIIKIQAFIRGCLTRKYYAPTGRHAMSLKRRLSEMKHVNITSKKEKSESNEVHIVYEDGTEYHGYIIQ